MVMAFTAFGLVPMPREGTKHMTTHASSGRRSAAAAAAAGFAIAMGCVPLAFADPASKNYDKHLAVDCPQPYSQTCPTRQGISFDSTGDASDSVNFFFQADPNPPACAPGLVTLYVDGNPVGAPELVQPGGASKDHKGRLKPGPHLVEAQMQGTPGGCNTGSMSGWSGTLFVNTDQPTSTTPAPEPGGPNRPQGPPPGGTSPAQTNTMVFKALGHGPTVNINLEDEKRSWTVSSKDLPWDYSEVVDAKPGNLYQIVVSAKGDAVAGCEIDYEGQVVASQPVNNTSSQCIWTVPPR
jgi:hypothetical protein